MTRREIRDVLYVWAVPVVLFLLGWLLLGCAQVQEKAVSDVISPEAAEKLIGEGDIPEGVIKFAFALWQDFLRIRAEIGDEVGGDQQKTQTTAQSGSPQAVGIQIDGLALVLVAALIGFLWWQYRRQRREANMGSTAFHDLAASMYEAGDQGGVKQVRTRFKQKRSGDVGRWANKKMEDWRVKL